MVCSFEGGEKLSGSINYGEFLDWLNKQQECQQYHRDYQNIWQGKERTSLGSPDG